MEPVADVAVVNASPLIILAKSGHLGLLAVAARRVVVPERVLQEVAVGPGDELQVIQGSSLVEVVQSPPVPEEIVRADLGAGESEVLASAAAHPGCAALVDDAAARRCARALGVPVRGTLSLIAAAKQQGAVASAAATIADLRSAGLWVSERLVRAVLASVRE